MCKAHDELRPMVTAQLKKRKYRERIEYLAEAFKESRSAGYFVCIVALELSVREGGVLPPDVESVVVLYDAPR